MSFRSIAAKNLSLRMIGVIAFTGAALIANGGTNAVRVQARRIDAPPKVRLPNESTGIEGIAKALVATFDQVDVVALGEVHQRKLDSELRIAVVRNPDFAKKVRFIVVEFASTTEQEMLDRYIRGDSVSRAQLEQVWKTTTQAKSGVWDDPVYADFFEAVRNVNSKLPPDARIRVLGGDPGPGDNRSRETAAVAVLKEQVLKRQGKALVIYGAGHFYRFASSGRDSHSVMGDIGIVKTLDIDYPGRTFVVIPLGGDPDYKEFARAVLVPCVNIQGSEGTLGKFADGCLYVRDGTDAKTKAKPIR